MAQWIRRWSTEPEILGSIPSGVVFSFWPFRFISSSPSWTSAGCSTAAATLIHRWFHSLVSRIESQFLCTWAPYPSPQALVQHSAAGQILIPFPASTEAIIYSSKLVAQRFFLEKTIAKCITSPRKLATSHYQN